MASSGYAKSCNAQLPRPETSPDEPLWSNLQAKPPKFLRILISPFMIGAGTMTMPGWEKRNWAAGLAFLTALAV